MNRLLIAFALLGSALTSVVEPSPTPECAEARPPAPQLA
jgi:hypothetical protein